MTETKAPAYVIAPEGCKQPFTAGNRYEVHGWEGAETDEKGAFFYCKNDYGGMTFTALRGSTYLNCGDWIIPDEAEAAPDDDGWIEWSGGECPVAPRTEVEACFDDGYSVFNRAGNLVWKRPSGGLDILRYRIVSPAPEASQVDGAEVSPRTDRSLGGLYHAGDGGPAFPCEGGDLSGLYASPGMSLRAYAAVAAMQGIMANERTSYSAGHENIIAKSAVAQADALLAALGGE